MYRVCVMQQESIWSLDLLGASRKKDHFFWIAGVLFVLYDDQQ